MIRHNHIKEGLKQGKSYIGTFIKGTDPSLIEIVGLCGFDFVIIDNEHTLMSNETLMNLLRTADRMDILPTVRVREINDALIRQVLDAGALGIQVPLVDSKADAQSVIDSTKYAPVGKRGFAASQRSAKYGFMNAAEYAKVSNENTMVACYCETLESIKNLDEILTLPELDIVFIGPYDISQALGVLGEVNHPKVLAAIDEIISKTKKAGKAAGIIAANAEAAKKLIAKGAQYICLSSDFAMVAESGKQLIKGCKE